MLGRDWKTRLESIIEDWVQEQGVEHYADKKTGEVDPKAYKQFLAAIPLLRDEAHKRLKRYEEWCTAKRWRYGMRPFDWRYETTDRIKQHLNHPNSKLPDLRKPYVSSEETPSPRTWAKDSFEISKPDPESAPARAYKIFKETGKYPERKKEPLNVVLDEVCEDLKKKWPELSRDSD